MKNRILLVCLLFSSISYGQLNHLLISSTNELPLKLEGVKVGDLILMDKEFEKIHRFFGEPTSISCEDRFSEEITVITFSSFSLTYVNIHGRGELTEIHVWDDRFDVTLESTSLFSLDSIQRLTSNRKEYSLGHVAGELTRNEVSGKNSEIIVLAVEQSKILKVIYLHDLQI